MRNILCIREYVAETETENVVSDTKYLSGWSLIY